MLEMNIFLTKEFSLCKTWHIRCGAFSVRQMELILGEQVDIMSFVDPGKEGFFLFGQSKE